MVNQPRSSSRVAQFNATTMVQAVISDRVKNLRALLAQNNTLKKIPAL
ncbi:hypothetical protein [Microseira wollei]|nr:hypothetical protein [Microseira wollei]